MSIVPDPRNFIAGYAYSVNGKTVTFPRAEIIVYGHTHLPLLELVDRTVTVMNPGGAGPARFDLKPSVGIMELEPGIPPRARLLELAR